VPRAGSFCNTGEVEIAEAQEQAGLWGLYIEPGSGGGRYAIYMLFSPQIPEGFILKNVVKVPLVDESVLRTVGLVVVFGENTPSMFSGYLAVKSDIVLRGMARNECPAGGGDMAGRTSYFVRTHADISAGAFESGLSVCHEGVDVNIGLVHFVFLSTVHVPKVKFPIV